MAVAGLLAATSARAAVIPLAVTGFNEDVIVSASGTASNYVDGGGQHTFYDAAYATAFYATSTSPAYAAVLAGAFPTGTVAGASGNEYTFAPDTGNEDLFDAGTLTLTTPASVSNLYILGTSSNSTTDSYTLNFASGPAQSGTITFGDWYGGNTGDVNGLSRVDGGNPSTYEANTAGGFSLYADEILVSSSSPLVSITITPTDGAFSNIFAVSGTPSVPEPSSWAMMLLGAAGLILVRRLRRGTA